MTRDQDSFSQRVRDSLQRHRLTLVSGGYSALAACALLPILVQLGTDRALAYGQIAAVLGGIGGNLIANIAEGAYTRARAEGEEYDLRILASILDRQIHADEHLSEEVAALVDKSGALTAAADILYDLPEQWDQFARKLLDEVTGLSGATVIVENLRVDRLTLVRAERATQADSLVVEYVRLLGETTDDLRLGTIDPKFEIDSPIKLSQVYVPALVAPTSRSSVVGSTDATDAVDLISRLALHRPPGGIVLLGGPGSGKTALLDRLTNSLALAILASLQSTTGHPDARRSGTTIPGWTAPLLLPVRVSLQAFAASGLPADATHGSTAYLWEHIVQRLRADALSEFAAPLNYILSGKLDFGGSVAKGRGIGGLLLLDGLDEVPAHQRCIVEESIDQLAKRFKDSLVIVTCRTYSWTQSRDAQTNDGASPLLDPSAYRVYEITPFSRAQISLFIRRWYAAVRRLKHLSDDVVQHRTQSLTDAAALPALAPLAQRPLLLTLMATLHTSRGELPNDRATLYSDCVQLLLEVWQRAKDLHVGGKVTVEGGLLEEFGVASSDVERVLRNLAYKLHASQAPTSHQADRTSPTVVTADELRRAFKPLVGDSWDTADRVVSYLQRRAGLLEWVGDEAYRFPHRTFQEFLAACHLLDEPEAPELLLDHFLREPAWWAEVLALAVGRQSRVAYSQAILTLATALRGAERCRSKTQFFTTLLNAARDIALAQRQDDAPHYRDLLHQLIAGYLEHAGLTLDSRVARERGSLFADTSRTLIPHVLPLLDHQQAGDGAALYLGLYGGIELVPRLVSRLDDADPCVVARAAHALGGIKDRGAVVPLMQLYQEGPEEDVILEVVRALGRIRGPDAIRTLIHALCRSDEEISSAAADALADVDDDSAARMLRQRAQDADPHITPHIIRALSLMNSEEATRSLIALLDDEVSGPLARDALIDSAINVDLILEAYHETDEYEVEENLRYVLTALDHQFLWREKDRDYTDQLIAELLEGDVEAEP